jgi:uncharacterized protein
MVGAVYTTSGKSRRKVLEHSERLQLDDRNGLRVAIVADTHSHPHPRAAELLRAERPTAILHAGDIGDLDVLDQLAKIAPVIAVRGNIDERAPHLPDVVSIDVCAGEQSALRLVITHIAVYGAKLRADAAQLAARHSARIVVCGHSHVPFLGRDRGLTVFNPGSIGPRRMHLPIVFGMMEIVDAKLGFRHIDCETGNAWSP